MRSVVASDLHIFPFSQFAEYDSQGVPDRLTVYLELARQMCSYGRDNGIKVCILPGDICNAAVNKPMTLAIAARFLEMLTSQFDVYIIPGQHDLDSKSDSIASVHSIIKIFDNNSKLKYINDEQVYQIEDKKVYFRAWRQEGIIPNLDADVFVGHGIVKGASIPDGFIFNDGASVDDLYSKYQLSIIGDIHNGQIFSDPKTDRKVLIPGTPFQNTHKDAEICGIWDVSVTDSVVLKFERIIGPPFHYFYTDNGTPNQGLQYYNQDQRKKYVHVRKVEPKKKPSSNSTVPQSASNSSNQVEQIMVEEIHHLKPGNVKLCEQIINRLVSDVHVPNTKSIPNIQLQKLEVHNFGNIDHYEIDLEHTPSPLLIYGANGCLTGDTKISLLDGTEVPIKDLVNKEKFWVYSWDNEKKEVVPGLAHSARITKLNAPIYKVTLDNGESIRCTSNHPFMLRNGSYLPAERLQPNDSLMPLYRRINDNGYEEVLYNQEKWYQTHWISAWSKYGKENCYKRIQPNCGNVIHHASFNKRNNNPDELELMGWFDHRDLHNNLLKDRLENDKNFSVKVREGARKWISNKNKDKDFIKLQGDSKRKKGVLEKYSKALIEYNSNHPCKRDDITIEKIIEHLINCKDCSLTCLYTKLQCSMQRIYNVLNNNDTNLIKLSQEYNVKLSKRSIAKNHKVISVELLKEQETVYDITVERHHNFALSSGVFVHNSGKSTLLDSIYWALEGKTTKKLSVAKVVKRKSTDGCYVKLTFLRNGEVCTILRSRNSKQYGTNLIINGDLEKSSKADTQKLIQEQLGLDSNIILNSVYLSSRSIVVFGELTPANKYDLIGLLTDNEIVDAYRDQAKRYKDLCEKKITDLTNENSSVIQSIDTIEKTIAKLRTQEENSKKTVDHTLLFTKLKGIVEKYIPAGLNINEALPLIDNIKVSKEFLEFLKGMVDYADIKAKGNALSIKRSELLPKITIAENIVSLSDKSLKEYNDQWSKISTTSICYTCKSMLADKQAEELKKTLNEKIVSAVNEKGKYEYQIQIDKKVLEEVDTELNKYTSQITKYNMYVHSLNEITSLELELSSVKVIDNSSAIVELESNKSKLEIDKKQKGEQLLSEQSNLASYKLIHDTLLARNGSLIKRLVRGVCDNISLEIDNLLKDSTRIKCVVTMQDGSPKILAWIDEEECEYEELSSGEKQIIDLAVLIAFNNLIAKKFNQDNGILGSVFLDEVFCYLDPENAELANSILAKSVATLVMVVTHDHNLQDHFNNKLHVSKKGGSAVYQLLV